MELSDYTQLLRRRWRVLAVVLMACIIGGVALILVTPVTYEATARVFVSTASSQDPSQLAAGNSFTVARVQSYTQVATSPDVTQPVVNQLGLSMSPGALASRISASSPANTVLIDLHVQDASPVLAAQLANAVAAQFSRVVEQLEQPATSVTSPVKLTVTQPATAPSTPVAPDKTTDIGLAVAAGLALGVAAAVLRDRLDNTFAGPEPLAESLELPVMGMVPWDKRVGRSPVALRHDPHGSRAEAFRQLRTNLQFVNVDEPPRVIAVASALPGEGKTHTSINLAASLAESGARVCLVEADLRRPTVAASLGLVEEVGLTSVLIGRADLNHVLQPVGNLAVLASGPIPPNPGELLGSTNFQKVLKELSADNDLVVIDTAPLLPVADGLEVTAIADATLLVVRAGKTKREQAQRALEGLTRVGARPVGTILSMAPLRRAGKYVYYYGQYRPRSRRGGPAD